jgi:predicted dehydrogenase
MIRIGIIGFGTIARTAHVPAMNAVGGFELKGIVTRQGGGPDGVACFDSAEKLLATLGSELDAAVVATPPDVRTAIAHQCLDAGLDLLLEKPPAATLGEIEGVAAHAERAGRVLFASWHSQHAPAVERAGKLLAATRIVAGRVDWREDVNKYHPGQDWVWEAGGFGVFDPGINALSILTRIIPDRLVVTRAEMDVPEGKQSPIAARLSLAGPAIEKALDLTFDWNPTPADEWTIGLDLAGDRRLELRKGGSELWLDGVREDTPGPDEYPHLFKIFSELVAARRSRVDTAPLRIVEDAFLRGRRLPAPAFAWTTVPR